MKIFVSLILGLCFFSFIEAPIEATIHNHNDVKIHPISHATTVIEMGEKIIYSDPTQGKDAFKGYKKPDAVVITHTHGDHLNIETLEGLDLKDVPIVVPQSVADKLPDTFKNQLIILANDETKMVAGIEITGVPMYNIRPGVTNHIKGVGNGYVLELNEKRVYIAGDTGDHKEMRNLKDIDVALVPMNLPYTMPVANAADGVAAMSPKKVYPFHYRNKDKSLSDVAEFKELVNAKNPKVEVVLLDWYPKKP